VFTNELQHVLHLHYNQFGKVLFQQIMQETKANRLHTVEVLLLSLDPSKGFSLAAVVISFG
jgi:hypothetical protein